MTTSTDAPKDPRLVEAEIKKARADAIAAELDLKLKEIDLAEQQSKHDHEVWLRDNSQSTQNYNDALEDHSYGVVRFIGGVDGGEDSTVEKARSDLRVLAALRPGQPIRLEFNSGGGSVYAGLDLFDEIRRISGDIRKNQKAKDKRPAITTVITGRAASMAGILVQAGDWRVIGKNAYLHLHEVSAITWGKSAEMADDVDFYKRLTQHAAKIYAERATLAGKPITAKKVFSMFDRTELWLDADQALELGFVDEIA